MTLWLVCAAALAADGAIEIGTVDQKTPPTVKQLAPPKSTDKLKVVDVKTAIKGKLQKGESQSVHVLVCPATNEELRGNWWVQADVDRNEDAFECECQFGEESGGAGECFAVIAIATSKPLNAGDQIKDLPKDARYSKVLFVKRKP